MNTKTKKFDIDLCRNSSTWFDYVGQEDPSEKYAFYHQYGSFLMGSDIGGFWSVYKLDTRECWACHWHGGIEEEVLRKDVIEAIDRCFPGTNGNIAEQTWVYLSHLPVATWGGVELPPNITVEHNDDVYRHGTLVKIVMPNPEYRTDIDDYYVCRDVEKTLIDTPLCRKEGMGLKHLAFIETECSC